MAAYLGFRLSSSSSASTSCLAPSATFVTYQPFLLVRRIFDPSRLNGPTENDSVFSLRSSVDGAPAVAAGFFSSGGLGVRLRGLASSTRWTNTSPFFA